MHQVLYQTLSYTFSCIILTSNCKKQSQVNEVTYPRVYDIRTIYSILWFSPIFQPRSLTTKWFVQRGPFFTPQHPHKQESCAGNETRWQKQLHKQEKPVRVHINQMTGVRAFSYNSGTISETWDDTEPEIKVVEIRLVFQGKVSLPSALSPERMWQSCYLSNFKLMVKAMKKFLKESVIAYSFWCPTIDLLCNIF